MKPITRTLCMIMVSALCAFTILGQRPLSASEKKIFLGVERQAKGYIDLRKKMAGNLPKISKDSTPDEISAHKAALQKAIQSARTRVAPGNIFSPHAKVLIRSLIKSQFKGYERVEFRKAVLEADTRGVPLRINFPYPESKELVEMSPELLLSLPQLPKELRYRYIGRSLVILDRDTALIIDFMKEALP